MTDLQIELDARERADILVMVNHYHFKSNLEWKNNRCKGISEIRTTSLDDEKEKEIFQRLDKDGTAETYIEKVIRDFERKEKIRINRENITSTMETWTIAGTFEMISNDQLNTRKWKEFPGEGKFLDVLFTIKINSQNEEYPDVKDETEFQSKEKPVHTAPRRPKKDIKPNKSRRTEREEPYKITPIKMEPERRRRDTTGKREKKKYVFDISSDEVREIPEERNPDIEIEMKHNIMDRMNHCTNTAITLSPEQKEKMIGNMIKDAEARIKYRIMEDLRSNPTANIDRNDYSIYEFVDEKIFTLARDIEYDLAFRIRHVNNIRVNYFNEHYEEIIERYLRQVKDGLFPILSSFIFPMTPRNEALDRLYREQQIKTKRNRAFQRIRDKEQKEKQEATRRKDMLRKGANQTLAATNIKKERMSPDIELPKPRYNRSAPS